MRTGVGKSSFAVACRGRLRAVDGRVQPLAYEQARDGVCIPQPDVRASPLRLPGWRSGFPDAGRLLRDRLRQRGSSLRSDTERHPYSFVGERHQSTRSCHPTDHGGELGRSPGAAPRDAAAHGGSADRDAPLGFRFPRDAPVGNFDRPSRSCHRQIHSLDACGRETRLDGRRACCIIRNVAIGFRHAVRGGRRMRTDGISIPLADVVGARRAHARQTAARATRASDRLPICQRVQQRLQATDRMRTRKVLQVKFGQDRIFAQTTNIADT